MFDTVYVWAQLVDPGRVVSRLGGVRAKTNGRPGIVGWLPSGARVKIYGDYASVEFELPVLASSAFPTARQTAAVIASIEEALGERLDAASVSRLDVFADLPLSRPVADYLHLLVWAPKAPRTPFYDPASGVLQTVAFATKAVYQHYYDRPALERSKGIDADGDVARYELQHRKTVRRLFGASVTPTDLSCPAFRARCAGLWLDRHTRVLSLPTVSPFTCGMDQERHLALRGLLATPEAFGEYAAAYDDAEKAGAITTAKRNREKGSLRDMLRDDRYTHPHPLRVELDSLVEDAAARMAGGRKRIV